MNPPAPGPVSSDSATNDMSTQATAASTAFPPARSASTPAWAVTGCPAATTPFIGSSSHADASGPFKRTLAARGRQRYRRGMNSGTSTSARAPAMLSRPRRTLGSASAGIRSSLRGLPARNCGLSP